MGPGVWYRDAGRTARRGEIRNEELRIRNFHPPPELQFPLPVSLRPARCHFLHCSNSSLRNLVTRPGRTMLKVAPVSSTSHSTSRGRQGLAHRRCLASRFAIPHFGFKETTQRISVPGILSGRAKKGKRIEIYSASAAGGPQRPPSEKGFSRWARVGCRNLRRALYSI